VLLSSFTFDLSPALANMSMASSVVHSWRRIGILASTISCMRWRMRVAICSVIGSPMFMSQ